MSRAFDADSADLALETRRESAGVVIAAHGEVTVFTSPALRQELRKAVADKPGRLVVDLSETSYIDSSGVATLVEGLKLMQPHRGRLVLAGMNERVRGVFEIARLNSVFRVAETVEEALRP
jgi:anti-sigma B factor antagonist